MPLLFPNLLFDVSRDAPVSAVHSRAILLNHELHASVVHVPAVSVSKDVHAFALHGLAVPICVSAVHSPVIPVSRERL